MYVLQLWTSSICLSISLLWKYHLTTSLTVQSILFTRGKGAELNTVFPVIERKLFYVMIDRSIRQRWKFYGKPEIDNGRIFSHFQYYISRTSICRIWHICHGSTTVVMAWWNAPSLGCPSGTKFWRSIFCFLPKLTLGMNSSKNIFWIFPEVGKFWKKNWSYLGQGLTLVQSRSLNSKILFWRDTLTLSLSGEVHSLE